MGVVLAYSENDQEHKSWADDLGLLQGGIVKGTTNSDTPNAYYMGIELLAEYPAARAQGEKFLKKDCTGKGSGNSTRSKNRVVVKIDANGALIEGAAWLWRHDNRVVQLGPGFFKRAEMMRNFVIKQ